MSVSNSRESGVAPEEASAALRERLLESAQRVFAQSGYDGTTVDDIITAAGTSRATFYRYFKGKDAIFDELSRSCFRDMRAVVKKLAQFDPAVAGREGLEELVAMYRDLQVRQGGVIRAWLERADRAGSPLRKEAARTFGLLLKGLERPIELAGGASGVDAEVRAALLWIAINRSSFYVLHRLSRVDPDRLIPTLATMIHRVYFGDDPPRRQGRLRIASD
jgi:AcrR family transcriptional regulator